MKKIVALMFVILFLSGCGGTGEGDDKHLPTAAFDISYIAENTRKFENRSLDAESFSWDFGNGTTSNEKSPTITFSEGSFNVTLTARNGFGEDTVSKVVLIKLIEKSKVTLHNPENITPAGFDISWDVEKGDQAGISEFFIQLSSDEEFKNVLEIPNQPDFGTGMVKTYQHTNFSFQDLTPAKEYFTRIITKYTYAGEPSTLVSNVVSAKTSNMPDPAITIEKNSESPLFFRLSSKISIEGTWSKTPEMTIEFFSDKEMTIPFKVNDGYNGETSKLEGNYNFSILKEPSTIVFLRATATFDDVKSVSSSSFKTDESFMIVRSEENLLWSGDHSVKIPGPESTGFEIGNPTGEKIIFNVKDFKGLGIYPLSHSTDGNMPDNSAIYFDGKTEYPYYLYRDDIRLNCYRETEDAYFMRAEDTNGSISPFISLRQTDSKDKPTAYFSGMIFKITK